MQHTCIRKHRVAVLLFARMVPCFLVPEFGGQPCLRDLLFDVFGIHLSTHDHFLLLYIDVDRVDPYGTVGRGRSADVSRLFFRSSPSSFSSRGKVGAPSTFPSTLRTDPAHPWQVMATRSTTSVIVECGSGFAIPRTNGRCALLPRLWHPDRLGRNVPFCPGQTHPNEPEGVRVDRGDVPPTSRKDPARIRPGPGSFFSAGEGNGRDTSQGDVCPVE